MHKICIWMNIPSHYQSAFYHALDARDDVDLQVAYFNGASESRAAEGWKNDHELKPYERFIDPCGTPADFVSAVEGWEGCTHIISGYFSSELIEYFCANSIRWCHWSEAPGVRLAEALGYRTGLFRLFNPLMLYCKRSEGRRIRRYAIGAFGQGRLAHKAFRAMGVPDGKIADLYYAPTGLSKADPCASMVEFANGRKVFLAVGALCRRKGIDLLLKAFASLDAADWCLVLCGLDKSNGEYRGLAAKLGVSGQVLFLGAYPVDRISEVYCAADVFVLPSRFDGWGAVLNEAASVGLPVIGTDLCGGAWHVVDDGATGFRARAGSVRSLKQTMQHYVNDPALARPHGDTAIRRFREHFSPQSNAERMVRALERWVGQ